MRLVILERFSGWYIRPADPERNRVASEAGSSDAGIEFPRRRAALYNVDELAYRLSMG